MDFYCANYRTEEKNLFGKWKVDKEDPSWRKKQYIVIAESEEEAKGKI